jgi:hypothetical protein
VLLPTPAIARSLCRSNLRANRKGALFFNSVHPPPLMPRWATALPFVIPTGAKRRGGTCSFTRTHANANKRSTHPTDSMEDQPGSKTPTDHPLASHSFANLDTHSDTPPRNPQTPHIQLKIKHFNSPRTPDPPTGTLTAEFQRAYHFLTNNRVLSRRQCISPRSSRQNEKNNEEGPPEEPWGTCEAHSTGNG